MFSSRTCQYKLHTLGVVNEEMLHLCLVGNALRGIGSLPILYDASVIPQYPGPMLGRTPELILNLRRLTKSNVDTFVSVRRGYSMNQSPSYGRWYAG